MTTAFASRQIGGLDLAQARAHLTRWPHFAEPIGADEYQQRLEHAREGMRQQGVDALLITAGSSLRYFSGISWGASERLVGMLLTLRGEPVVICPAFEIGSLAHALKIPASIRLWEEHESPHALIATAMGERHASCLALDPAAAYTIATHLRDALGQPHIADASAIINGCRMCKSAAELALMKQATAMTLQVQQIAAALIHEGISNVELTRFIDEAHRALGADNGSTFCIVQFGQATAYPHGIPGEQRLAPDELVLIDTGCSVQGYNSDITRCYIFGRPSNEHEQIWALERA
ncbi:MAG: M24 family metallopeptidase, partial [Rhodanobacter sp.]